MRSPGPGGASHDEQAGDRLAATVAVYCYLCGSTVLGNHMQLGTFALVTINIKTSVPWSQWLHFGERQPRVTSGFLSRAELD